MKHVFAVILTVVILTTTLFSQVVFAIPYTVPLVSGEYDYLSDIIGYSTYRMNPLDILSDALEEVFWGFRQIFQSFFSFDTVSVDVTDLFPELDSIVFDARKAVHLPLQLMTIDGSSMEPTLQHQDKVFILDFFYEPAGGDIVVFEPRGDQNRYYIKRVIATEGQTIDIREGYVYVDGERLQETYIAEQIEEEYPGRYPKTVPKDCVFVMGDNRNNSLDSRDESRVGMVEENSIIGKAVFRIFPVSTFGSLYKN